MRSHNNTMATSKRSMKRPLSLSLSQPSHLETSRSRRKKNISSQDCGISNADSKTFSVVSEEDNNPRRKLVEEWLERNNSDVYTGSNIVSGDETSQETVLLEGNCHLLDTDQNNGQSDQPGIVPMKQDVEVILEKVVEDNVMKREVVQDDVVKQEVAKDNVVKNEVVIENEPGTSGGPTAEEEPLLQCPLCWKNFEKPQTQAAHLKACAAANGLTTRQLINAVDLHKKQLAERKKLGLFPMVAPPAASKKLAPKKTDGQTVRKSRRPEDSNLELALALSLSLAQGEERQGSLNAYGFTSKSTGPKKSAPVLLTRTQAERERLITEKVAIVLMDEPESSQPSSNSQEARPTLQSAQLQEWCNEDNPLWKKSHTSPSQSDPTTFYVSALGNVIAPSKTEVGTKLRHLSQLPGRINTPKKVKQIVTAVLYEVFQDPLSKPGNEQEKRPGGSILSECLSASNTLSLAKLEQDVKAKHFSDWASMLKNSSMSDVTIYVRGGMSIPAHKLVLGVRCPQILRDVTKQQNQVTGLQVDVLLWPDTPNDAATCFLEYIYYGSIRSIHTLRKDMSGLRWLADRYEATDLIYVLSYFERKRAVKNLSDVRSVRSPSPEPQVLSDISSIRSQDTVAVVNDLADAGSLKSSDCKESEDMFLDVKKESSVSNSAIHSRTTEEKDASLVSNHSIHSQKTVIPKNRSESPDPFSDEYEFSLSPSLKSGIQESAVRKLSFDSTPRLGSNVLSHIDGLAMGSPTNPESVCSGEQANSSPSRKSSVDSKNAESPQSDKSTNSSRTPGETLKRSSPLKVLNVSPLSDLPAFDVGSQYPSGSQRFPSSQRPVFPADDDDVVIISDDEEEKKTPARSQRHQRHRDLLSMSTESLKSPKSPSPSRNSPYISPVWNGFDDMPCDISMGQNWDDEALREINRSPVQEKMQCDVNWDDEPCISPVQENGRSDMSPVHETSPVRERCLDTSPVQGSQGISPIRINKIHDISDSASSDGELAAGNVCGDMLNDSMNAILASSLLERVVKDHETPERKLKRKGDNGTDSGRVTPMKNYREMTTPEIKVELQKFGMKPALGKRKGVLMLEHIYNSLHPRVPVDEGISQSQPTTARPSPQRFSSSQPSSSRAPNACTLNSSSSSSSSSSAEGLSEAESTDSDSDSGTVMSQRRTKTLSAAELPNIVTKHIEKDRILHRKILEYEPIFIEHLHSDLKDDGYKFKIADLMAYLGEKCINYRSVKVPGGRTRKKTNQNGNPRKKRPANSDLPNSKSGY